MVEITIDLETMNLIKVFERVTRTKVVDCIFDDRKMIFVVPSRKISQALGKNGANVRKLRDILKKNIDIVEYSDDPEVFIKNIFHRFRVRGVDINNMPRGLVAYVHVDPVDKGKAIGKAGSNLKLASTLVKRHFGVDEVYIQ